jgi:transcriptional regulator with XRE-family HTH domain
MTSQTQIAQKTLGADVRTLRKARGLTLSQMAESMGKSVGWLSQVERDLSTPRDISCVQMRDAIFQNVKRV